MEAIILGNPYDIVQGSVVPIEVPAYEAEEAVIELSDGYNPYIIGGSTSADSYWFRYPTGLLRPLTISDNVVIGGTSLLGTEIFRVEGQTNLSELRIGLSVVVEDISNDVTLINDSPISLVTEHAVKTYVDNIGGLQPGDNIS